MKHRIKFTLFLFFLLLYLSVFFVIYFFNFEGIVSDYEAWTTFATLYSAVVTPVFSFLSFVYLIYTFSEQMKEKHKDDNEKIFRFYFARLDRSLKELPKNLNLHYSQHEITTSDHAFSIYWNCLTEFLIEYKQNISKKPSERIYNKYIEFADITTVFNYCIELYFFIYNHIQNMKGNKGLYLKLLENRISVHALRIILTFELPDGFYDFIKKSKYAQTIEGLRPYLVTFEKYYNDIENDSTAKEAYNNFMIGELKNINLSSDIS